MNTARVFVHVIHRGPRQGLTVYELQSWSPITSRWYMRLTEPTLLEFVRRLFERGLDWNQLSFTTCLHPE